MADELRAGIETFKTLLEAKEIMKDMVDIIMELEAEIGRLRVNESTLENIPNNQEKQIAELEKHNDKLVEDIAKHEREMFKKEEKLADLEKQNKLWHDRARKWEQMQQQSLYDKADTIATIEKEVEKYKQISKTEDGKVIKETSYIIIPLRKWKEIKKVTE